MQEDMDQKIAEQVYKVSIGAGLASGAKVVMPVGRLGGTPTAYQGARSEAGDKSGVYVEDVRYTPQPVPPVESISVHLSVKAARYLVRFLEHAKGRDPYNPSREVGTPFCPSSCTYDGEIVTPLLNAVKAAVGPWRDSSGHTTNGR